MQLRSKPELGLNGRDGALGEMGSPGLLDALAKRLRRRERRSFVRSRRAAVLALFVVDGGPLRLIFTRRTEHLPTHKGQVAFPGGGMEPVDGSVAAAALREAYEEIGLPPNAVEVLGNLDDFLTIGEEKAVTPVVGRVTRLPNLVAAPGEVARVFEIPVALLLQRERWTIRDWRHSGRVWPIYLFPYDGETLWGLTAYMTLHLLDLMEVKAPFDMPTPPEY